MNDTYLHISLALLVIVSPIICTNTLTSTDIRTFQTLVNNNLTTAIRKLTDEVLQPEHVADIFGSSRQLELHPVSESDVRSMLAQMTKRVASEYDDVRSALMDLKDKLQTFLQSPRKPFSGRPPVVQACCRSRPPSQQLSINTKVGVPVDTRDVCYGRNKATVGIGFDLWADEVMDTMKNIFKTRPGVLWQEFALDNGLHVQFPAADRSCPDTGIGTETSNSKLLRPWFRERLSVGSVNLVFVVDASDRMTNKIFRPGSKLPPVSHWEIVKNAVTETLATLLPDDKVSILTTGEMGVAMPWGCGQSLVNVNQENIQDLDSFIQSVVPKGDPKYVDAFKKAFDLLIQQEKTSDVYSASSLNVVIFLTNGDTVITQEEQLFQTFTDGQASLLDKAHIQVYALKQLYVSTLPTWMQVADQNNQRLVVSDGSNNNTAKPWKNVAGPQGPKGYLEVMEDTKGFKLSETVTRFHRRLPQKQNIPQDVVLYTQDDNAQLVTSLVNMSKIGTPPYGIVSVNVSLSHLIDNVMTFQFGTHSYGFVIDTTGHVIFHPKMVKRTPAAVKMTMDVLEPELTSSQKFSIQSSGKTGAVFAAKLSVGRELFLRGRSGPLMDAFIGHKLVEGTRCVVCAVIFKSEMKTQTVLSKPMAASGKAVYHRFDLLPSGIPSCARNGQQSSPHNDMGIKFSHELYVDPQDASDEGNSLKNVLELNRFTQNQAIYPNILKAVSKDEIQNDLKVFQSEDFKTIWEKSKIDPIYRFLGTKAGVLAIQPATPLVSSVDYKDFSWYGEALNRPKKTVILMENFLGQKQLVISKVIQHNHRIQGVVGASIPNPILKALVFNEVPLCQRSGSTCKFMDYKGNVLEFWGPTTTRHITQEYPWLANKLLQLNILKSSWSYSISSNAMELEYLMELPNTGINSIGMAPNTQECRKFVLYPMHNTNLFILLLADRSIHNCSSESYNPGETCVASKTMKPVATTPGGPPHPPPFTPPPPLTTPHGGPPPPFTPPPPLTTPHGGPPPPFTPSPPLTTPRGPPPPPFFPPALTTPPHGPPPPPFTPPPLNKPPSYRKTRVILTPPPLPHKSISSTAPTPSSSSLLRCTHCPQTPSSPSPIICQTLCQCEAVVDGCTKTIKAESWRYSNHFRIHNNFHPGLSVLSLRPQKPAPPMPACPKRCSQISDKTECISNTKCTWNDDKLVPICIILIPETTSTKPALTTTLLIPPSIKQQLPHSGTTSSNVHSVKPSIVPCRQTPSHSQHPPASPPGVAPASMSSSVSSYSTATNSSAREADSESDDSSTSFIVGMTIGVICLFTFLLVLFWKLSVTRGFFKKHQVSDFSDTVCDGKRHSQDGLIIQVREVEDGPHPY